LTDALQVEVRSRADLRAWLAENHATSPAVWLVVWRKHTDHHLPWGEAVSELLCWGWIDSTPRAVDDDRTSFLIAPRNPRSAWSGINKAKVAEARAAAQMTEAGEAVIARALANGMWDFLDDVEAGILPDDLSQAPDETGARKGWAEYPSSIQRATLEWIKTAKTSGTRSKRIDDVARSAGKGERPTPFRR
jgi:uncharacterized protein YdeI (YjbR/CyaY-like superfamily)